jgi:hypothetical protein
VCFLPVADPVGPQFALADGTNYALECGRVFLGKVKKIKAALGK